jgi:DNA invertase Pin-like site-specific DNA recombinase
LDRLTRAGISTIFQLLDSFSAYGVKVFSYQEIWTEQPNQAMYELLVAIFGWVAKEECKRRSERTKAGMARAAANGTRSGKKIGRPKKASAIASGI